APWGEPGGTRSAGQSLPIRPGARQKRERGPPAPSGPPGSPASAGRRTVARVRGSAPTARGPNQSLPRTGRAPPAHDGLPPIPREPAAELRRSAALGEAGLGAATLPGRRAARTGRGARPGAAVRTGEQTT